MPDASPIDPAVVRPLTDSQLETGISEIRRIINQSVGYRFADEIVPFAHKELALRALEQLRTALADTRRVEPNYCYDPDNWEVTLEWKDRDLVHGEGDGLLPGKAMLVKTLLCGPDKWVADIPVAEDETEVRWFDSKEEADAAMAATPEGR